NEISDIENGSADREDNELKNSPHTVFDVTSDNWDHSFMREKACFPSGYLKLNKFWPPVARIDNAYGDKNLVCTCPAVEEYEEEAAE
ncbi:UNVERIFIED_CONTAM: hypothetical protein DQE83_27275, partial [Escherichia coli]